MYVNNAFTDSATNVLSSPDYLVTRKRVEKTNAHGLGVETKLRKKSLSE